MPAPITPSTPSTHSSAAPVSPAASPSPSAHDGVDWGTRLAELRAAYDREGWFTLPYRFADESVGLLRERVRSISEQRRPEVVQEEDSASVRAIHGCHAFDEVCAALARHPLFVGLAEGIVGSSVYVYQFKVNLKPAHEGAAWPWHQDFSFWNREDGMPRTDAVNIAVSLDDTHQENGPLIVIPGTHRSGLLDGAEQRPESDGSGWLQHVSKNLTYTVPDTTAKGLAERNGQVAVVGAAGSVHVFHPSIVHSSSNNLSADRRALLLITYNAVENAPEEPSRPEFLVSRDPTPVSARDDDRLLLEPVG